MRFKVGDRVIVVKPEGTFSIHKNRIGTVVDTVTTMVSVQFDDGCSFLVYNREIEIAKNHIVSEILKDL